jgi:diacylglycerol O-acyltransferase
VLECPLAELKSAGKVGGGSVNDAFVAALLGGLRIYHERHGVELGPSADGDAGVIA